MNITKAVSIRDFQDNLSFMYDDKNKERSVEYIYSYLSRNAAYLSRSVLREGKVEEFYIKTLSWLISLSNKLDIDLQDCLFKKFPDACPYCTAKPCECIQNHKKPSSPKPAYKIKETLDRLYGGMINAPSSRNKSIDSVVQMVNEIYPSNQAVWTIHGSFYHFTRIFEELGEIHEAYSTYIKDESRKVNLEEEIADFTAWFLSAWKIQNPQISLMERLRDYYISGCPVCKNEKCACGDYEDRQEAIVKLTDLEKIKNELIELQNLTNIKSVEFTDLIKSLDVAIETKSTTDAKRVLDQTKETLDNIEKSSSSIVGIGENAMKIAALIAKVSGTMYSWAS